MSATIHRFAPPPDNCNASPEIQSTRVNVITKLPASVLGKIACLGGSAESLLNLSKRVTVQRECKPRDPVLTSTPVRSIVKFTTFDEKVYSKLVKLPQCDLTILFGDNYRVKGMVELLAKAHDIICARSDECTDVIETLKLEAEDRALVSFYHALPERLRDRLRAPKEGPDAKTIRSTFENQKRELQAFDYLDLGYKSLKKLPKELVEYFPNLIDLYLIHNQLTSLPPNIGNLTALRALNLRGNQLTSLPPNIDKLTALIGLRVDDNRLRDLHPNIGNLTTLQLLDLEGNNLVFLPPNIGNLIDLKYLSLKGNQLTSLPHAIGKLIALKGLYLKGNKLTSLPNAIGTLRALLCLDLNSNQLESLPADFSNLTTLKDLDLRGNHLTPIHPNIKRLRSLRLLFTDDNQYTSLPEKIRKFIAERLRAE